ncbi:MAG: hypothetical protein P4L80_16550 [Xanthobacteraceae bacterium]|nr:hypothetical protein [Xanthobacteraceae bacterium]
MTAFATVSPAEAAIDPSAAFSLAFIYTQWSVTAGIPTGVTVPPNFAIAQPVRPGDRLEVIDIARKFSVAPMMKSENCREKILIL